MSLCFCVVLFFLHYFLLKFALVLCNSGICLTVPFDDMPIGYKFLMCVYFQRAFHVYSEARRVYAFRDTVLSKLRYVH